MAEAFGVRGVIEGFYGPPWSGDDRVGVMSALSGRGMNAYVYAPKDDPYHRSRWREAYPADLLDGLVRTAGRLADVGVRFGFGVSPGLDIDYADPSDRQALARKLAPLVDAGVDWVVPAFDDVPLREGSGAGQAGLVSWLADRFPGVEVTVVPTDYVGTQPSRYLDELASGLPAGTALMWTGRTVVSPTITLSEARARREATGGLPLLIWDNYPVNDAFMTASLHLGPYVGRSPELSSVCAGVLANPMPQAQASRLALATVADFLHSPGEYDAAGAWAAAVADLAAGAPQMQTAVAILGRACGSGALEPRAPLMELVDGVRSGEPGAAAALRAELEGVAGLADRLPADLAAEAGPWAAQAEREATAGLAALAIIESRSDPTWGGVLGVMGMLLAWAAARQGPQVAFGARFACYPAITQGPGGSVTVDPELAVVEDANAIDHLCRHALAGLGEPVS